MSTKGLDQDGFIAREGSLDRVASAFAPVVRAARVAITDAFDSTRLHSAYLYGSVPRGTAVPGVSDLDLLLALRSAPTAADRAAADALEAALDGAFEQVNGVSLLLFSTDTLLSELERYDLGWMVACLCTPLLGDDLAARLPRYRTSSELARESNGDLASALTRWRGRAAALPTHDPSTHDPDPHDPSTHDPDPHDPSTGTPVAGDPGAGDPATDAERRRLNRAVTRRIVRTGFTLVMPRWGGWTSDLAESAEVFGRYYPERAAQMRRAAAIARVSTADTSSLGMLLDDLGPWLAAEYIAVHGERTPRA